MKHKNTYVPILIISIFLWGIALRSVELINGNYLFGHDHGRDYLAAYNIVENHKQTLIGAEAGSGVAGINGIFHGPGYFYLISLAYLLFHGNPIGGQIFMLVFGILALLVSCYMGFKIFGKVGSVVLLFFIAVSPLIVSQSRFIWSTHPITLFILFAVYFVYKIPQNPRKFAPLAVFISGFTYNSQLGVAVPLTLAVLLSLPLIYKIRDVRVYIYCAFAFFLAFLPMFIFEARHGFMAIRSAWGYVLHGSTAGGSMFEAKRLYLHGLDYWYNFTNTFTFEFGWISNYVQKIVLLLFLPFIVFGLFQVRELRHRRFIAFLILMIITTWAGYLVLNNTVWDYYLTHVRLGYILLFTYAIVSFIQKKKNVFFRSLGMLFSVIFLLVLFIGSMFRMYITYTSDLHDTGKFEKIQGKRFVLDTIYRDANGQPFSVFVFIPSVYTWPYDYLFKTYGRQTYGYEPDLEKKGLAYLIIEPDISKPWRQKGWLETVVQGGETVWTKTILNGLILEKRVYPL